MPAQASAAQPETDEPTPSQPQGPELQIEEVEYNNAVGRVAFFNVSDAAMATFDEVEVAEKPNLESLDAFETPFPEHQYQARQRSFRSTRGSWSTFPCTAARMEKLDTAAEIRIYDGTDLHPVDNDSTGDPSA